MMLKDKRPPSTLTFTSNNGNSIKEARCLYALITGKRPVSRRNRASWYLNQLNKIVRCANPSDKIDDDELPSVQSEVLDNDGTKNTDKSNSVNEKTNIDYINYQTNNETDIRLMSITSYQNGENTLTGNQFDNNRSYDNYSNNINNTDNINSQYEQYRVTPNTRVLYLSRSIATSILLDLSPSVVSVSSQNGCVFLDSMFDAVKRVLHLLVKRHEIPSSQTEHNSSDYVDDNKKRFTLEPKVFVSVIAYTPFIVAKSNQVLVQNRRICSNNIEQVLVEIWICLNRLTQEIYDLVSSTCNFNFDFNTSSNSGNVFVFPSQPQSKITANSAIIRPPGSVLEDLFELGLFSSSLMPRLSRLSMVIISDGLFASTNNLSIFRLKSIAVSFVSLASETSCSPDACFGYTPYNDLMKFIAKTTLGVHLSYQDLLNSSHCLAKNKQIPFLSNPLKKLFCWTLHSENSSDHQFCDTPLTTTLDCSSYSFTTTNNNNNNNSSSPVNNQQQQQSSSTLYQQSSEVTLEHISRYFCVDQPSDSFQPYLGYNNGNNDNNVGNQTNIDCAHIERTNNYHDWRSFRQLDRNLDADFEQVLACLLREGYLIKNIQFKHKESTRIVARLVLHWRHNLDLEQELTAPYWNNTNPFGLDDNNHQLIPTMRPFNTPQYGDTYCEVFVHGSYSFLHNLYCDRRSTKRRSEFRDISYKQYRQLIDGVMQTQERLQYLSKFYRDSSLSKVPSFLLHGNSLLYEQPHTHRLTSTIENVLDECKTSEFQEYWQKISCLDTKSWKNLMHVHTLRLVLEHDQPKHKNIHYQNANGRYTHVQCRRALSAISNFIKTYSSFALLEDTTYIKFIYNRDDDLREIETSATKGFIVIRINKLLPIVVIYLMFTSGILDSHRIKIVSYLETQLINCKLRNVRSSSVTQIDNILRSKTISPSGEACCVLLRSPLERMLKVYSRNFVNDFLIHNLAHGLPGSCPHTLTTRSTQSVFRSNGSDQQQQQQNNTNPTKQSYNRSMSNSEQANRDSNEGYTPNSTINQFNLIFGKYLYGFRTVQTIANLPNDLLTSLASNVLSKISAISVNIRIKQGFHIAFNNSGILNLVVELSMKDHSNQDHASSCLCQYIVFPPTVTSPNNHCQSLQTVLNNSLIYNNSQTGSKPNSLSGSLANSESYMKVAGNSNVLGDNSSPHNQQSSLHMRNITNDSGNTNNTSNNNNNNNNKGEIKIIKEYWIEQQYGTSSESESYHNSLQELRYSEVVDHLFITDSIVFECLLTYELLQLMCDKLSLYYELDSALSNNEPIMSPLFSPISMTTTNSSSTTPSSILEQQYLTTSTTCLPSTLIEGNTKDGNPKVPLLEMGYKFSVMRFLDYCQQASLNVLLFRDHSEFGASTTLEDELLSLETRSKSVLTTKLNTGFHQESSLLNNTTTINDNPKPNQMTRKISVDTNEFDNSGEHATSRREHRSSYQHDNSQAFYTYTNPIYSPSLNHMFLETLHRRLKQMHDKELKLSDFDRQRLPLYLKRRKLFCEDSNSDTILLSKKVDRTHYPSSEVPQSKQELLADDDEDYYDDEDDDNDDDNDNLKFKKANIKSGSIIENCKVDGELINWRCFLRKGNQENLMIVLIPATLNDITAWLNYVNSSNDSNSTSYINDDCIGNNRKRYDPVCPIYVFRCSSTMINDHLMSILDDNNHNKPNTHIKSSLEADISLHFGQACRYMGKLEAYNDELSVEVLPLTAGFNNSSSQTTSDEKTLEVVHFRAFLRKIKNTVLKSRFSSLNDAYLSELFIHKDDILYYINNVDFDTQKKYHVSSQLKSLAEFIKNYQDYSDSLPKEPVKKCNQLLNSILLQKCGLFINQPIARFNESNPLIKQLHDRKLLFLMRSNYKIDLPILEESLTNSTLLKNFVKLGGSSSNVAQSGLTNYYQQTTISHRTNQTHHQQQQPILSANIMGNNQTDSSSLLSTSLGKSVGNAFRQQEMKCGSLGASSNGYHHIGSPSSTTNTILQAENRQHHHHHQQQQQSRLAGSDTTLNSYSTSFNDNVILEAFRGLKSCPIKEVTMDGIDESDISLRHEAHMAEVLMRFGERKESQHYRRVLKSKANYNQSHGAIDQALKRVDSLGRLEHFCLTPILFSPSWRSKLAPVRDHTIETNNSDCDVDHYENAGSSMDPRIDVNLATGDSEQTITKSYCGLASVNNKSTNQANDKNLLEQQNEEAPNGLPSKQQQQQQQQQEMDERWHVMVCNNYIKEYEQYIQTLGFNSVQIRYQSNTSTSQTTNQFKQQQQLNNNTTSNKNTQQYLQGSSPTKYASSSSSNLTGTNQQKLARDPYGSNQQPGQQQLNNNSIPITQNNSSNITYNTGYLIKFLNSGCLVFKVGFCKPYVYSILYSIEGERFNNSNVRLNMTAFLDELDNIKVTMHLHSFTYDYHLRSMYSYISGRQLTFSPGYHLISFLDDFRKYYQKAPNYARNHLLTGDVSITDIKVSGQQLYNYIVTHNSTYNMEVLEMNSSLDSLIADLSSRTFISEQDGQQQQSNNNNNNPNKLDSSSLTSVGQPNINKSQQVESNTNRNHANDYVLIELKREKVRYRDGKEPDVFDCGLLITHDVQQTNQSASKNNLTLKYFLLLTNQRDLYPKLIHNYDSIISSGCHRPIRLGLATTQQQQQQQHSHSNNKQAKGRDNLKSKQSLINKNHQQDHTTQATSINTDADEVPLNELQSSSEISGPLSIQSTTNSTQSTGSNGLQFGLQADNNNKNSTSILNAKEVLTSSSSNSASSVVPKVNVINDMEQTTINNNANKSCEVAVVGSTEHQIQSLKKSTFSSSNLSTIVMGDNTLQMSTNDANYLSVSSNEDNNYYKQGTDVDDKKVVSSNKSTTILEHEQQSSSNSSSKHRKRINSSGSGRKNYERTICDEEITYLGYFSSDEMDVLKFLQQKTNNLRSHIEEIVRSAEIHYRRDYLWHKLMQRTALNSKSDEILLTNEELIQLLAIVEAIDLSVLDPQLSMFTTMNFNWYSKLIKAFGDLKQSGSNQHRIYTIKVDNKSLLLYIDPNCTSSCILLMIDQERGSIQLNMLLKNKQECSKITTRSNKMSQTSSIGAAGGAASCSSSSNIGGGATIDFDQDCQQLINDFVNFCATFMWSSLLV